MNFKIVFLVFFVIIFASIGYDNFYTTNLISGSYRYNFPFAVPEGPSEGDKLTLFDNGNFKSDTWGSGTFKIVESHLVRMNLVFKLKFIDHISGGCLE